MTLDKAGTDRLVLSWGDSSLGRLGRPGSGSPPAPVVIVDPVLAPFSDVRSIGASGSGLLVVVIVLAVICRRGRAAHLGLLELVQRVIELHFELKVL